MARQRRIFGPLFYTTVAVAMVATAYLGIVTLEQRYLAQVEGSVTPAPAAVVAAWVPMLKDAKWETRRSAVIALEKVLRGVGPTDRVSGFRQDAVDALRAALGDESGPVRTAAGDALSVFPQFGRHAKAELTAALRDDDPAVRLAACRALVVAGESVPLALETCAGSLAVTLSDAERIAVIGTMLSAGERGVSAAVEIVLKLLSSPDRDQRAAGLDCLPGLQADISPMRPHLEQLFGSDDARARCAGALVATQSSPSGAAAGSRLARVLEQSVVDVTLPLDLRECALTSLLPSAVLLRECGLALAKQLTHENRETRLAAATLLRMIDAESLAGPPPPPKAP